jgi:glutamate formiminotransferase/formiminotetrahydrofolate cyclodeaminase
VGLVPERGLLSAGADYLKLPDAGDHLLEAKIRATEGPTLDGWIDELASSSPVPGGGSASALAGALAAALVEMVCRLTLGRKAYATVEGQVSDILREAVGLRAELRRLVDDDAAAYTKVSEAYTIPKEAPHRAHAIDTALIGAARAPLQGAHKAVRVHALASQLGEIGNKNARSDAAVARQLAVAAIRGMVANAQVNLESLSDKSLGTAMGTAVQQLLEDFGP